MSLDAVLSREELAALLADPQLRPGAARPESAPPRRTSPVARALAGFAEEQSRLASTVHQRPIRFELLRCGPVPIGEFAASLSEQDRAFALRLAGVHGSGALVIGRSLLFGWLAMAFGAPASLEVPIPRRAYTRIETRFLRRLAEELVRPLVASLGDALPGVCEVGELVEPELLAEVATPRVFASAFEVAGLGEPGRLRIGFPETWLAGTDRQSVGGAEAGSARVEQFLEMPLDVRAEIGVSRLPVRELCALKPGDVIPLEQFPGGNLRVRVAGVHKFTAVRGSAGQRAAIRIVAG